MFGTLKGRLLVILGVMALAAVALWQNGIKLGLDLQGGMHLALEVQDPNGTLTAQQRADYTDQNLEILRNRIDQFGVTEPNIQKIGQDRIIVELPGITDEERAKDVIRQQAFLEWKLVLGSDALVSALPRMDRAVVQALGEEGLRALDEAAATDTAASVGAQQDVRDLLFGQVDSAAGTPGTDTTAADTAAAAQTPLSSLILQGSGDGEFAVAEADVPRVKELLALPGVMNALPRNAELRWGADPYGVEGQALYRPLYVLQTRPFLTGERLEEAIAGRDPMTAETIVQFQLDRRGGRIFEEVTSENLQKRIAIVLDTLVHSAPVVNQRIGANGQITLGQSPMTEAQDLALVLRAGAFAAPLEIIEQRQVGPSLGRDSIDQGILAGIIGISLVVLIMVGYYRVAGMLAVLALSIYVLLVMGGLAGMNATLTAPGIAGLILSIGMAVDANVLIFERIREELALGRTTRVAVDEGFKHAMSAIVDSNLTTLITALILFQVGTGPVRGFAVTLSIGIIASFFTAVFITRTFFLVYLDRKRASDAISI
ncbi:MAG TPA: protein translocase subunit SecD [Longimicrobiales bacterium]|nr:protein translocase subunit SecD [Longimicrobiales bacterium]